MQLIKSARINIFILLVAAAVPVQAITPVKSPASIIITVAKCLLGNPQNRIDCLYMGYTYLPMIMLWTYEPVGYTNASERINDFVNSIARERGLTKKIKCVEVPLEKHIRVDDIYGIIHIAPHHVTQLNALLEAKESGKPLTTEQESLWYYYLGLVHHELTHVERQSSTWTRAMPWFIHLLYFTAFNHSSLVRHNVVRWCSSIVVYLATYYLIAKYDEHKAEEGLPLDKRILQEKLKFYEESSQLLRQMLIDQRKSLTDIPKEDRNAVQRFLIWFLNTKRFDKYPLLYEIFVYPHPSPMLSLKQCKERLKAAKE